MICRIALMTAEHGKIYFTVRYDPTWGFRWHDAEYNE